MSLCRKLLMLVLEQRWLGGVVLWSRSFTPTAAQDVSSPATSPVNSLIREALIEGRSTDEKYEKDGYAIRWTFVNELELIFVVSGTNAGHQWHDVFTYRSVRPIGSVSAHPAINICRGTTRCNQDPFREAL